MEQFLRSPARVGTSVNSAWIRRDVDETVMGIFHWFPVNINFAVLRVGFWNAFSFAQHSRIKHGHLLNLLPYPQEWNQRRFRE